MPRYSRTAALIVPLVLASCGGGGSATSGPGPGPGPDKPAPAHHLVITVQPSRVEVRRPFADPIRVEVRDTTDEVVTTSTVAITLLLLDSTSSKARLLGDATTAARAGVALFPELRVDAPAGSYRLFAMSEGIDQITSDSFSVIVPRRHVIVLVGDGLGYKQAEAANRYTKTTPAYQGWAHHAMTTWDINTREWHKGLGYDPSKAWSDFAYLTAAFTDSASSATAMFTGVKTYTGQVSVAGNKTRLTTIHELAAARGLGSGAVSSVPITHATPAAWTSHNSSRANTYAIGDEALFGHPNTTGDSTKHPYWGGHWGPTLPGLDVLIGGGHPGWLPDAYLTAGMVEKARDDHGSPRPWTLVERLLGKPDGGARLLAAANDPGVTRLLGIWGGANGNIEFRHADGKGHDPENPTLPEMTRAALAVLERRPLGFALLVEGGAIDWASHGNFMDDCVGEVIDFNRAVDVVARWVDDPTNGSSWANTLVIVTGDHETGLLTAGPGVFPNLPLGEVSNRTMALEKYDLIRGLRASWDDTNNNDTIDASEQLHWTWNSAGHSNSLIPLYAKGIESGDFAKHVVAVDPERGRYVDNTAVFTVVLRALQLR